jgi:hypothetical protein
MEDVTHAASGETTNSQELIAPAVPDFTGKYHFSVG